MAKRKDKKEFSNQWIQDVTSEPLTFHPWKQWSRHLPVSSVGRKKKSFYGNKGLGLFFIGIGLVIAFTLFIALSDSILNGFMAATVVWVVIGFVIGSVLIWYGVKHIRYSK